METFTKNQVIDAIKSFLEYGEKTYTPDRLPGDYTKHGQNGYFSGTGWAARCLRFHLEELKEDKSKISRPTPHYFWPF